MADYQRCRFDGTALLGAPSRRMEVIEQTGVEHQDLAAEAFFGGRTE